MFACKIEGCWCPFCQAEVFHHSDFSRGLGRADMLVSLHALVEICADMEPVDELHSPHDADLEEESTREKYTEVGTAATRAPSLTL